MSKPIEEILPPKPEPRLLIYAWTPNDPPAEYDGLIKVGQTTQEDVNARIRQSQGQMQQPTRCTLLRRPSVTMGPRFATAMSANASSTRASRT